MNDERLEAFKKAVQYCLNVTHIAEVPYRSHQNNQPLTTGEGLLLNALSRIRRSLQGAWDDEKSERRSGC